MLAVASPIKQRQDKQRDDNSEQYRLLAPVAALILRGHQAFPQMLFINAVHDGRALLGCRLYTIHTTPIEHSRGELDEGRTSIHLHVPLPTQYSPSKLICSDRPQNVFPAWLKEIAMAQIVRSGIIVFMGLTVTAAGVVVIIYG